MTVIRIVYISIFFNLLVFSMNGQSYVEWAPFEKVKKKEVWIEFRYKSKNHTHKLLEAYYDTTGFVKEFKFFNLLDSSAILYHAVFEIYTPIWIPALLKLFRKKSL